MKGVREGVVLSALAATFCLYHVYSNYGRKWALIETETMAATVNCPVNYPNFSRLETETETTTTNKVFADLDMDSRLNFVAKRCKEVNAWRDRGELGEPLVTVLVNHKHKLSVCSNLKVGSSTIANIMYTLRNTSDITQKIYRTQVLKHELSAPIVNILPYPRAMFVREPLDRLYSAFRDKRGVRTINGSNESFEMFLLDVLKVDNVSLINTHHVSYYNRCRPCEVPYDVIGTMETFGKDVKHFFQGRMINLDVIQKKNARHTSDEKKKRTLSNLPLEIKRAIWERYYEDYYIFGYPKPF